MAYSTWVYKTNNLSDCEGFCLNEGVCYMNWIKIYNNATGVMFLRGLVKFDCKYTYKQAHKKFGSKTNLTPCRKPSKEYIKEFKKNLSFEEYGTTVEDDFTCDAGEVLKMIESGCSISDIKNMAYGLWVNNSKKYGSQIKERDISLNRISMGTDLTKKYVEDMQELRYTVKDIKKMLCKY